MLNASNNAQTRLTQSINNSQTEIMVEDVSLFPQPPFVITINNEIMLVTDTNGVALTVERGQENTVATGHFADTVVEHRWTAGMYNKVKREVEDVDDDLQTHKAQNATDDVHGLLSGGRIIEESGINENGRYTKFANGDLWCQAFFPDLQGTETSTKVDNIYTSESLTWNFPYHFSEQPSFTVSVSGARQWGDFSGARGQDRTLSIPYRIFGTRESLATVDVHLMAFGRWK